MKYTKTREPIVEGLFYPENSSDLKNKIDELLKKNSQETLDSNCIVVPHGGYDYSGDYIATGFNSLKKKEYSRVIIISNVHREFSNSITIPEAEYFKIGSNSIKVDLDAIKIIQRVGKKIVKSNTPHMEEHGIEVVLPFINHLYPKAKIVPILLGKTVVSLVRNLANIIKEIEDENTLIIISSNFSDFENEKESLKYGELALSLIQDGKMGDLVELTRTNKLKTCGSGAIASLILNGNYNKIRILKEGLTPKTPLSGDKATFYATLSFSMS
ncbi:AmmeMemoRadiSam system protein B [Thiospirochaeta perfilievii]|uniref:AmmeMemoRadiSam system protein B n=1 Tax=Thiospirochaeta perfilievii TaxID=252967 RepID=A0A5C1QEN5_9SPIO|nr:AmmeMemoRadiSam system protein B [Thiospirochaeta perfilievii]QEN05469.1 AmmeMemoRadiSam system protein B [Thiospirochaeta perfilievii]